jgi:hypothetical protein
MEKYHAETTKCLSAYMRDFTDLPKLLSALAGGFRRPAATSPADPRGRAFIIIPPALLWIVAWDALQLGSPLVSGARVSVFLGGKRLSGGGPGPGPRYCGGPGVGDIVFGPPISLSWSGCFSIFRLVQGSILRLRR